MKKVEYSNIAAGVQQPFTKNTWQHIQEAFQEPITAIGKMLSGNYSGVTILWGCVDSTDGPSSGTYTVTAGAVYYNGEVYLVDAATVTPGGGNTLVGTITTTYIASDPLLFTDGSTHDVHAIRKIVLAAGVSGSGTADYDDWHQAGAFKKKSLASGDITPTGTTISSVTNAHLSHTRIGNVMMVTYSLNLVMAAGTCSALLVDLSSILSAVNTSAFNGYGMCALDQSSAIYASVFVNNNSTNLSILPIGGTYFSTSTSLSLSGQLFIQI